VPTSTVSSSELVLDVSAELPFEEPSVVASSVHLPQDEDEAPPAVLICWPGGSYARSYWDMQIPGHPGYSFAEHLTAKGFVVLAADHLGVGASSKPVDGDRVNFETMSAAAAAFVAHVRRMLADGSPALGAGRFHRYRSSGSGIRSAPVSPSCIKRDIAATTRWRCSASRTGRRRSR
jgi:hypothetical protein